MNTRRAALLFVAMSTACGTTQSAVETSRSALAAAPENDWEMVADVAPLPYDGDCAMGALGMVLSRDGVMPVRFGPKSAVTVQAMRSEAERHGMRGFVFVGSVAQLRQNLQRGRPIIVGLVEPDGDHAHYEVVIGYHPGTDRIATIDPKRGLVKRSTASFESMWVPAKRAALVVAPYPRGIVDRGPMARR